MKEATGIIPARYGSRRFPGKPLAEILGKPMIQWVYEGAKQANSLKNVIVATDDDRIVQACNAFGAEVWMTSPSHSSGTDRVAEVACQIESPIIINIQGDEPLLRGESLDRLVDALQDESTPMATLAIKVDDLSLIVDTNIVKVITDNDGFALYFSRSGLPFQASDYFLQHVGIYGYQQEFLLEFSQWPPSRLEKAEKLEQLRALEKGNRIKVLLSPHSTLSVDTPQDIIKVENFMKKDTHG
ncbi:3-deoxy-manno-octulosonate cytidylyltransferase [Acidobacteriota bacterium]